LALKPEPESQQAQQKVAPLLQVSGWTQAQESQPMQRTMYQPLGGRGMRLASMQQ
jgi:hypothetical protein